MLFNSIDFAVFLPIVFILYWFVTNNSLKLQNALIVVASYLFYGWWDWRFLSLIFFSTIVDYSVGVKLNTENNQSRRKLLLCTSILVNLGFLGFFKYYNFFLDNFISAFTFFGSEVNANSLNIILPVGISFYTFQTMSYTIDVYKRKLEPTSDFIAFSAFVSFFPQLVAGPIERAAHLLPQFFEKRTINYDELSDGLKKIVWGMFMKVAVADRLSLYVDDVYSDVALHGWTSLVIATFFFAFQIYCDFAGYSLIAIGTAKLFGFDLMTNFLRPYLASSFKGFWSRWHISLSSWFKDYVYIPLGGSRKSVFLTRVNLLVTFVLSGLWHGANWTFIVWGTLHGIYQIIEKRKWSFTLPRLIRVLIVFALTNMAWIFFRSENIQESLTVIRKIMILDSQDLYIGDIGIFSFSLLSISILMASDIVTEHFPNLRLFSHKLLVVRFVSISFVVIYILTLGVFDNSQFIYFQF